MFSLEMKKDIANIFAYLKSTRSDHFVVKSAKGLEKLTKLKKGRYRSVPTSTYHIKHW